MRKGLPSCCTTDVDLHSSTQRIQTAQLSKNRMLLQLLGGFVLVNAACSVAFDSTHIISQTNLNTQIKIEAVAGVLLILIGTLKGLFGPREPDVVLKDGKWTVQTAITSTGETAMKLGHPLREIDLDIANACVDVHAYLEHDGSHPPLKELALKYKKFKESL